MNSMATSFVISRLLVFCLFYLELLYHVNEDFVIFFFHILYLTYWQLNKDRNLVLHLLSLWVLVNACMRDFSTDITTLDFKKIKKKCKLIRILISSLISVFLVLVEHLLHQDYIGLGIECRAALVKTHPMAVSVSFELTFAGYRSGLKFLNNRMPEFLWKDQQGL